MTARLSIWSNPTGEIEACPDGASIPIDEHHCLFIEPADEDFDEGISEDWEDEL